MNDQAGGQDRELSFSFCRDKGVLLNRDGSAAVLSYQGEIDFDDLEKMLTLPSGTSVAAGRRTAGAT